MSKAKDIKARARRRIKNHIFVGCITALDLAEMGDTGAAFDAVLDLSDKIQDIVTNANVELLDRLDEYERAYADFIAEDGE